MGWWHIGGSSSPAMSCDYLIVVQLKILLNASRLKKSKRSFENDMALRRTENKETPTTCPSLIEVEENCGLLLGEKYRFGKVAEKKTTCFKRFVIL